MDIPSWAVKGQEVICINDDWELDGFPLPTRVPMLNEVLTIEHVVVREDSFTFMGATFEPGVFLSFEEIPHCQEAEGWRALIVFLVTQFRPLKKISLEADVALFAHHFDDKRLPA